MKKSGLKGAFTLDVASVCMKYIRLLILCYMDATLQVMSNVCSSKHRISKKDTLPEVLLRFHRNAKTEEIINRLFSEKIESIFSSLDMMSREGDRRIKK
jgi:hypothetical protein